MLTEWKHFLVQSLWHTYYYSCLTRCIRCYIFAGGIRFTLDVQNSKWSLVVSIWNEIVASLAWYLSQATNALWSLLAFRDPRSDWWSPRTRTVAAFVLDFCSQKQLALICGGVTSWCAFAIALFVTAHHSELFFVQHDVCCWRMCQHWVPDSPW